MCLTHLTPHVFTTPPTLLTSDPEVGAVLWMFPDTLSETPGFGASGCRALENPAHLGAEGPPGSTCGPREVTPWCPGSDSCHAVEINKGKSP